MKIIYPWATQYRSLSLNYNSVTELLRKLILSDDKVHLQPLLTSGFFPLLGVENLVFLT